MFGSFVEGKLASLFPYPTCAPSLNFGVIFTFCDLEIVSFLMVSFKGVPKENEKKETNKTKKNNFFNLLKDSVYIIIWGGFGACEDRRNFICHEFTNGIIQDSFEFLNFICLFQLLLVIYQQY